MQTSVSGLVYVENYISVEQECQLIENVDKSAWLQSQLIRRVQHYGYRYDYRARSVDRSDFLGPLPQWSQAVVNQITQDYAISYGLDQLIVNEYIPGQGIGAHRDCVPCFKDTIASLTLASGASMVFCHFETKEKFTIYLQARSLVILRHDARFLWSHSIPARLRDKVGDEFIDRNRRVSLTFRKVEVLTS